MVPTTSQGSVTLTLPAGVCSTVAQNCVIPFEVFNRGAAASIPYGTVFDRWLMKINTKINNKDQLSFRYLIDQSSDPGAPFSLAGQEVGQNVRNQSFTINDVYALNSSMINEAAAPTAASLASASAACSTPTSAATSPPSTRSSATRAPRSSATR